MVALIEKLMAVVAGLGFVAFAGANVALAGSATGIMDPGMAHRGAAETHCTAPERCWRGRRPCCPVTGSLSAACSRVARLRR